MTPDMSLVRRHLSIAEGAARTPGHIEPTAEHRGAAERYLLGEPVAAPLATVLERLEPTMTWAQRGYITEARAKGPTADVWENACWSVANALAGADERARVDS
jgi:hypothetical protein